MFTFPQPQYMPCAECGASVSREEKDHVCEPDRRLEYTLIQLRPELEDFERQWVSYLATPRGRFEAWYAANHR